MHGHQPTCIIVTYQYHILNPICGRRFSVYYFILHNSRKYGGCGGKTNLLFICTLFFALDPKLRAPHTRYTRLKNSVFTPTACKTSWLYPISPSSHLAVDFILYFAAVPFHRQLRVPTNAFKYNDAIRKLWSSTIPRSVLKNHTYVIFTVKLQP